VFDVVVVGGGPSGASAARRCAERGLRVALVEREKLPRYKPCGGGVSVKALQAIGVNLPEELVERRVFGFRFVSPRFESVEARLPVPMGVTTLREHFDHFLVHLAQEAGCQLMTGRVRRVLVGENHVHCMLAGGQEVKGRLVVGADGASGVVARSVGLRSRWRPLEVGVCFEGDVFVPQRQLEEALDPEILQLYYLGIPFGYGWVFPKRDRLAVGVGGQLAALRGPAAFRLFESFLRLVGRRLGLSLHPSRCHGHLLPAGGFRRRVVADRTLLAGDAAGFVDPLTGEGIYYAVRSGQLAGDACTEAVEQGRFDRSFLAGRYLPRCRREFVRDLRIAFMATILVHRHLHRFFALLRRLRGLDRYVGLLARDYANYRRLLLQLLPRLYRLPYLLLRRTSPHSQFH